MQKPYLVWCPENGEERDDAMHGNANYHEEAAEIWAQWYDAYSAEYSIVKGTEFEICVAEDIPDSEVRHFIVTGETQPVYRARPAHRPTTTEG